MPYMSWSHKERNWLKQNYGKVSVQECAEQLNRSEDSIRSQVAYLRKIGWTFNSTRR
jgi:biotin operon repressor